MKYILFHQDNLDWQMVYCTNDDDKTELLENIAKAMLYSGCERFNTEKHGCLNGVGIKDNENTFIVSEFGVKYVWQLGKGVKDMVGMTIPHLYYVRKIAIFVA